MPEIAGSSVSRGSQRWLRFALKCCVILLMVLCALPIALRYGGEYWLNEQPNMHARIGDIDLNLFSGTVKFKDVELQHFNKQVLAADLAAVQIDWLPLFQKHFFIQQVTLEGGGLWLTQALDEPLVIAGFSLPEEPTQPPPVLEQAPIDEPSQWGVHSGKITLKKFQLHYQVPHVDVNITVDQLNMEPLVSWRPDLLSPFRADLVVNGGALHLEGALSPFSRQTLADGSLRLSAFDLSTLASLFDSVGVSDASGQLDCALQLNLKRDDTEAQTLHLVLEGELNATAWQGGAVPVFVHRLSSLWSGKIEYLFSTSPQLAVNGDLSFSDVDLDLLASGLKVKQEQLFWRGTGGLNGGIFNLAGDLGASKGSIEDLEKQRQLLQLDQLDLKSLVMTGVEKITVDQLGLEGVYLFERGNGADSSHSIVMTQTTLSNLALRELNQLHVKALHLAGLNIALTRTSSGALDVQEWFHPAQNTGDEKVEGGKSIASEPPLVVQCDDVTIGQDSQVRLVDSTMEPAIPVTLTDIELQIEHLDSAKSQQASPLTFSSTVGRYANLEVTGHIKPFMQPIGLDLVGSLREFDVATVSPYSEKSIGYQLQQGHLNLDFTLPIADGLMALDSDIHLKQFRLQALSAEDEANASKGIGLPVNLALSVLRDREGDIHIQLPVHGDLNDPNLHIGPILRSAVLRTLHNAVMLPLAPLGIVSKAGEMVGIGNAVRFRRVEFEAGTAVMAPTSRGYLDSVAALLSERPQLVVTLCGRFTEQDHEAFKLEEGGEDVLRQKRRDLAEARAVVVKEQLLQSDQVEAAQMLLCRPMATVFSGSSGVDLTLQ